MRIEYAALFLGFMSWVILHKMRRYLQSFTSIWYIFSGFGIPFSIGPGAVHSLLQLQVDVMQSY